MVVAQRELLPTLVLEIEDELRILAVLAREDVLALEYGRVELAAAVEHEALAHDALDVLAAEHLARAVVARSLRRRACMSMRDHRADPGGGGARTLGVFRSSRSFFLPASLLPPAAFLSRASDFLSSPSFLRVSSSAVGSAFSRRSLLKSSVCVAISALMASGVDMVAM